MAAVRTQIGLLLWKNLTVRRRKPVLLVTELLLPLVLLAVLCYIRYEQPPERQPQTSYDARVLPSAGFIPVLESLFCTTGGQPDGFGFRRYPNSSSSAILEYVERTADQWRGPARGGGRPSGLPAEDVCDDSLGPKQNRTPVASAVVLWAAVQELVCGETPALPPNMNSTAEFVEYLGLDDYHKGRLAILFHMLSRNPRILFAPNTTQAWRIVAKANETLEYLDGLSTLARQFLSLPQPLPETLPIPAWQATLLSCAWLELTGGASLDLFRPAPSEAAAVDYFLNGAAADNVSVLAVLAFDLPPDGSLPNHLTYKIRQNASLTANTVAVRDRTWLPGPRDYDYNYYEFGFTWIQDLVERAVASLHAGRTVLEPAGAVHEMPYPCYVQDRFLFYLQTVMPLCLTLGWVCGVALHVQHLVQEREDRLREVMLALGVSVSAIRASWVLTALILATPSAVAVALMLCYGGILRYSSASLVFCLLQLFVIDNIALAHLLSALSMGRARTAAASSVILYFLAYVPYVYVSVVEQTAMLPVSTPVKVLTCLMSPSAFNYAFKYVGFYEQQGTGVDWHSWTVSPVENDSFNMALTMLIMLLDVVLYALLVWYIENVFPGPVGVPQPWYFPFSREYWRPGRTKDGGDGGDPQPDGGLLSEPEPRDLPLAVELRAVTKRFPGGRRPAVDGLSLRLFEGQVTALLGHNGAGKTTTLSILSGLLPACSGSVSVYGRETRRQLAAVRRSLGFCPQQDVLFDGLTAAEHVWFYGRMRGACGREALLQTISVLADVDLLKKRDCDVRLLSGGQRRKLSVAIAFLGGSRCIVLDEPTAGVDPHSRRAIWSLIVKYKPGRTILFCTHHMEEADVLGNRIAVLSAGKVKCVGSPMFLRRHLGAGYHLYLARAPPDLSPTPGSPRTPPDSSWNHGSVRDLESLQTPEAVRTSADSAATTESGWTPSDSGGTGSDAAEASPDTVGTPSDRSDDVCQQSGDAGADAVAALLRHHVPAARLVRASAHQLHFFLPAGRLAAGVLPRLLETLQQRMPALGVTGYGVQTTTMEEVFMRVTRHGDDDGAVPVDDAGSDPTLNDVTPAKSDVTETASDVTPAQSDVTAVKAAPPAMKRLAGRRLIWQQFVAVLMKRFYTARRDWTLLISQILLPAFFTFLAMSVAIVAPNVSDKPPLVMAPTQYFNYTWPNANVVPVANNQLDLLNPGFSTDANSESVADTLRLESGLGATCVLRDPFNASAGFDPLCDTVSHRVHKITAVAPEAAVTWPVEDGARSWLTTLPPDPQRLYPSCSCRPDGAGQTCSLGGYRLPLSSEVVTGDLLQNISRQPEPDFYRATTDIYRLRRYGGLSLGLVHDVTPAEFGRRLSPLARRTAVRRLAKAWFDNTGLHAVPAYVNALNNAVLRANLPAAAGDPAAYGVTCVNHPLPRTGTFSLEDEIRQGTDVLIALFVLVALSFVPASLVLGLVQERRQRSKHLQRLCGLDRTVYWAANYCWDLVICSLPSAACVLIMVAFNDPEYTSSANLPAVALLVFLYGWSMTPLMYPASFIFREPGSAYIAVVIFNLFVGAAALLTTSMFESFEDTQTVNTLKSIFLVLPNYCLGRGLLEIAYNQYHNDFLTKTGKASNIVSPLSAGLALRYIIAMVVMATVGLTVTLLLEHRPLWRRRLTRAPPPPRQPLEPDDVDVATERKRVTSGAAAGDVLKLDRLTKVYRGVGTAVDALCFGVARGECFGLLGVNGAGKTSTFRMLTGDATVTSGDALVKLQSDGRSTDVSVRRQLDTALSEVGYCPQHDALHGGMTVSEHLTVYAMIRGVPPAALQSEVDRLLGQLDLRTYADRPAAALSGGNRRKLSTALALVGSPQLVLLDEPTTGMDPAARRFLWELVRRLVAAGRSVLLTSHSMEECEALCTRLAVLVNGRLRCLGSPQHLKNRFGDGYTIMVRSGAADPADVDRRVKACLPDSRLKECHLNVWTYELGAGAVPLAEVFRRLERLTADLHIEDWHVSQNTLDSVFVSLARHQSECPDPEGAAAAVEAPIDDRVECPAPEPATPDLLTVRL